MIDLLLAAAALAAASPAATEVDRFPAEEAHQGVVADERHVYAIANSVIAKYDRKTRKRIAAWQGDPAKFIHMNSCSLIRAELICSLSNYPNTPMVSSIEWFDPKTMTHRRSLPLGHAYGSLTWVDWHDGSWWACFANYDGKGGEPGRDHRATTLVRYDKDFKELQRFRFPDTVLERFSPRSSSGGAWADDGLLYVTGHDRPELYVMRVPKAGDVLEHVGTFAIPTPGQAIAWQRGAKRILWGIERARNEVVAAQIPEVTR